MEYLIWNWCASINYHHVRVTRLLALGGCERIRNTPLATVYSITIRRFILIYLATLPFALLHKFEEEWLAPLATFLLAYSVLALDRIGIELQQPFSTGSLNHLPLHDICQTIEQNLLALLLPPGTPHCRPSLLRAAEALARSPTDNSLSQNRAAPVPVAPPVPDDAARHH